MNKYLKREINSYIKKVSKQVKSKLIIKRVILNDLKENIFEYYQMNPNITMEDIYNRFGTPNEISKSFNDLSTEELFKKAKKYKLIIWSGIIFIVISLILLFLFLQGYFIDVTIKNWKGGVEQWKK